MATLTEMVEEEATRAESEEPDEDEAEGEGEPEPEDEEEAEEESEAEPLGVIGEAEIKKAERAIEGQRKRLAGILGESYVAHECIFCSGLGFMPEPPPVGATFTIEGGPDGLAFSVAAPAPAIPLSQAPDKAMCDECDGWGEVLSGSKAQHGLVTPCSKCSGNGWVMVVRAEPYLAGVPPSAYPTAIVPEPPPGTFGPDAWGRPHGHQHWGVPPANIPG